MTNPTEQPNTTTDHIELGIRLFARPEAVDEEAARYVRLIQAAAEDASGTAMGDLTARMRIRILCDGCGATAPDPQSTTEKSLAVAAEHGWVRDTTQFTDLCPECVAAGRPASRD